MYFLSFLNASHPHEDAPTNMQRRTRIAALLVQPPFQIIRHFHYLLPGNRRGVDCANDDRNVVPYIIVEGKIYWRIAVDHCQEPSKSDHGFVD